MRTFKRALHSIWYYKKNTLLLLCVFFLLSALILYSVAILVLCRSQAGKLGDEIGGTVTVYNFDTSSYDVYYGANLISKESAQEMTNHPDVQKWDAMIYSMGAETEDVQAYATDWQKENFKDTTQFSFRVEGYTDMTMQLDYILGSLRMLEGRIIAQGDSYMAVISSEIAELNDLSVGDSFALNAFYENAYDPWTGEAYQGKPVTLEIAGVYHMTQQEEYSDPPLYNPENLIITSLDAAEQLNGYERLYSVQLFISDPDRIETIIDEIQAMDLPEKEVLDFEADARQYNAMQNSISNVLAFVSVILGSIVILGVTVLVLLILISLKSRMFEIGVLLSMGESKLQIILQLFIESYLPVLIAMCFAAAGGYILLPLLSDYFVGLAGQPLSFSGLSIFLLFAAGTILTMAATVITILKIVGYRPKQILTDIQ